MWLLGRFQSHFQVRMHNTLLERAKEIQTEGQQAQEEQDGRSGLLDDWRDDFSPSASWPSCHVFFSMKGNRESGKPKPMTFFMFGVWMK